MFAYGVTSSGKTHTIQGTKDQPGIIPRVVRVSCLRKTFPKLGLIVYSRDKDIFERSEADRDAETTIFVSYMEIYKEEAYDLLVDRDSVAYLYYSLLSFIFLCPCRPQNCLYGKTLPDKSSLRG